MEQVVSEAALIIVGVLSIITSVRYGYPLIIERIDESRFEAVEREVDVIVKTLILSERNVYCNYSVSLKLPRKCYLKLSEINQSLWIVVEVKDLEINAEPGIVKLRDGDVIVIREVYGRKKYSCKYLITPSKPFILASEHVTAGEGRITVCFSNLGNFTISTSVWRWNN